MKYIIYKTTNIINNYIYVGVHKTANPDVFDGYIGCGVYVNQPTTYNNPKTNFQIAVNEFGPKNFRREILAVVDTPEEASALEASIVNYNFLARPDVYNMILGGNYLLQGTAREFKKVYQYDMDGNFLKEWDSIVLAANSINKTESGIIRSIDFKFSCGGYYWNTDKIDKLDVSNYKVTIPTPVYCYSVEGGKLLYEFDSITKAAESLDLTIIEVSRSAKIGYRVKQYYFSFVKAQSYDRANTIYLRNRSVCKYNGVTGKFIKRYATQYEAEQDNPFSNITRSIKNKKVCKNGFKWSLEEVPVFCASSNSKKKKVGKFDLNGNLLQEWESVKACIAETGIPRAFITVGKKWHNHIYKGI